jgi:hypothetical protein
MSKKQMIPGIVLFAIFCLVIASPAMMYAQSAHPVRTAIDKIMDYKNGLDLTDAQIAKLAKANTIIIDKINASCKEAELHKMEIDDFTANWASMPTIAVDYTIKEYYDCMARVKSLELEAIMKARAVLSPEQLKRFTELSSIESMMIKVENQLAALY